jgi:uncharacterized protein (TIRG00374 family)
LLVGLALALASAFATSAAFLFKQRGAVAAPAVDGRHPLRSAAGLFHSRWWTIGWLVALGAWLLHVGALALAPLSIVQAVLSAGLVFLAVLADRFFGFHLGRRQWIGLVITAAGLVVVGLTSGSLHGGRSSLAGLIGVECGVLAIGGLLVFGSVKLDNTRRNEGMMLAVAAGALFGVSDVAIKYLTHSGDGDLLALLPWVLAALLAMVVSFYASARSLQLGPGLEVIALTSVAANIVAISGGILVFHDPIGSGPAQIVGRVLAFCFVVLGAGLMPAPTRARSGGGPRESAAAPAAPAARSGPGSSGSPQLPSPGRRHMPWRARPVVVTVLAAGGGALAVLAVTRLNFSHSLHTLTNVQPAFAVLTVALLSLSLIARSECWYVILRSASISARINRLVCTRATMIGVMVSATLPGRLGEPVRVYVVARRAGDARSSVARVAGTVLGQTLLNMAALVALAAVLVASLTVFRNAMWAIVVAAAIPIGVAAAVLAGPKVLDRAARGSTARGRAAAFLRTQIEQTRAGLRGFRRPRVALHASGAQLVAWALQLLACAALLSAFGIATPSRLGAAAAVLVATNVAAVLPITPGNVGVFQAACVAALAAYGVNAGRAIAYGIALQLLEVTTAIALGLPALLAEGLRPHDLRRASRQGAYPANGPDPSGSPDHEQREPNREAHSSRGPQRLRNDLETLPTAPD